MNSSRICAATYEHDRCPDTALAEAVRRLKARGVRVGGLLQGGAAGSASACATLFLEDLETERRVRIFQDRGMGSRGCRLDPSGLAEAAGWVREAIEGHPDVLFINRFGRQEAEGRGLLDEIAAAVSAGMPVVMALNQALLPAWRAFAGEEGEELAAEPDQLVAWCLERVPVPCA